VPKGHDKFAEEHSFTPSWYPGRNYDAFAILADVRNGRGFAGIKTGDGFKPIADPRGVPKDATAEYTKAVEQYGGDGHSHSHHTLRQLQDFPWEDLRTGHLGVVSSVQYAQWKKDGKPESWCGGVSGPSVTHVSNEEMDELITSGKLPTELPEGVRRQPIVDGETSYYTQVRWEEPYSESAGFLHSSLIPTLVDLSEKTGPDNIRIIFFFDN
jgi:hypothetical protein